ncbi:hypothetical protein [Sphingobacterium faecium]|uniref:hypothetical protein n=1 Tax=Sphingobacterium faecium TaxID=34087 RepID=UPI003207D2B8
MEYFEDTFQHEINIKTLLFSGIGDTIHYNVNDIDEGWEKRSPIKEYVIRATNFCNEYTDKNWRNRVTISNWKILAWECANKVNKKTVDAAFFECTIIVRFGCWI